MPKTALKTELTETRPTKNILKINCLKFNHQQT